MALLLVPMEGLRGLTKQESAKLFSPKVNETRKVQSSGYQLSSPLGDEWSPGPSSLHKCSSQGLKIEERRKAVPTEPTLLWAQLCTRHLIRIHVHRFLVVSEGNFTRACVFSEGAAPLSGVCVRACNSESNSPRSRSSCWPLRPLP